jgi:ubiquinone/menaquinone biosynthesis C-methylase UbiE
MKKNADETMGRSIIERWTAQIHPESILDIGCGDGIDLQNLARILPDHPRMVGVDTMRFRYDEVARLREEQQIPERLALQSKDFILYNSQFLSFTSYTDFVEYNRTKLAQVGIEYYDVNVEHDRLPFSDETFDLAIINQVLEHVREVYWILAEISRVVRPGGSVIFGVPNLASWYSRFQLLRGKTPPPSTVILCMCAGILPARFDNC